MWFNYIRDITMRILSVNTYDNIQQNNNTLFKLRSTNTYNRNVGITNQYSPIIFKSVLGKTPALRDRLVKQCDEILKENKPEITTEEWILKTVDTVTRFYNRKREKLEILYKKIKTAHNLNYKNQQEKANVVNKLIKELNKIKKSQPPKYFEKKDNEPNDTYDFVLINRFKNALLDGNFNLRKVFYDYYKPITDIKTIEELNEKFPLIKTPRRPEEVVSDKIVSKFGRSFYKEFDDYVKNNEFEKASDLAMQTAVKILSEVYGSNDIPISNSTAEKFLHALFNKVADKYHYHSLNNSINSIPEKIKTDKNLLSEQDFKILSIDYDDFALAIIQQQYLHLNKPIDVTYKVSPDSDFCINVSELRDTEYKFEKINEKIKKIISEAEKLRQREREYEKYTTDDFKQRIEFYTERFGDDNEIFDKMVEFDSSRFTHDDNIQLTKILKELDKVWDEDISLVEAKNGLNLKTIKPHGTYRLNDIERKEAYIKAKNEQKVISAIRHEQEKFDSVIDILYRNNLNYVADIASQYRPGLTTSSNENSLFLINLIQKYSDKDLRIKDRSLLQAKIIHWNKYIEYKNAGSNETIISKAEKFAVLKSGEVDKIKAGQYILNTEIIDNYPENKEYLNHADIIDKILESCVQNKEKAVEYLCKYNDYEMLSPSEKRKISAILNIFNIKNLTEKILIKNIVENEYIKTDTKKKAKLNDGKFVETAISAKAKQEIMDYYRFPKCLEIFEAFEDAMTTFAATRGSAGIKSLGTNNNTYRGVYELKILGHDDRLISYNGAYYFDEFDSKGLH